MGLEGLRGLIHPHWSEMEVVSCIIKCSNMCAISFLFSPLFGEWNIVVDEAISYLMRNTWTMNINLCLHLALFCLFALRFWSREQAFLNLNFLIFKELNCINTRFPLTRFSFPVYYHMIVLPTCLDQVFVQHSLYQLNIFCLVLLNIYLVVKSEV